MRVAVTGGSGIVGAAVVRHLVDVGHEVRALARSEEAKGKIESLGAEPVSGDLASPDRLRSLVERCHWVFHVAGVNELCSLRPERMREVNVEGTRAVMRACREANVVRMIYTSSAVTIGEEKGTVGRENSSHRGWYLSNYERSKAEAEHVAFAERGDLDVVVVNPSSVQGPGRATGTGRIVLDAVAGRLPFLIETHLSLVDIDDCARGHLLAAEKGVGGERYLLSGAALTMREAMLLLNQVLGRHEMPRFIRPWALQALGTVLEGAYRVAHKRPPLCRESARVMSFGHRYDGSRATTELGLDYTPVEETLSRTVQWFVAEGLWDGGGTITTNH